MRRTLFRLFAVALLAVSVPAQGIAAVTAGLCMALGHHDGGAAHHPDDGTSGQQGAGEAHCPPCVSCCAAAAIVAFPSAALPEPSRIWALAALHPFFSGVTPERLDRPPLAL